VTDAKTNEKDGASSSPRLSPMQQHQDHLRREQKQAQQALVKRRWRQAQAQQLQLALLGQIGSPHLGGCCYSSN
jgi:hypothetical protein